MCMPTQLDHDLFRILLYRKDATEILVETKPDGLHLPLVSVPAHTRTAEQITTAIQHMWNLETCCLFPLSREGSSEARVRYQVAEACHIDADVPARMKSLAVASLSPDAFEDSSQYEAIERSIAALDQYRNGQLSGTFGKPGWLRAVTEWVETLAAKAGLSLTGKFRQLNASPTFSLIRFETDGPALWFKAVGEPNLHEYSIILKLTAAFPDFVPRTVGSRPEWNAWLTLEAEGAPLDARSPASAWGAAAENLALLQISSLGRRFELIESGCKDLRPWALRSLVEPFFNSMTELMERQTKRSPAPLSRHELLALGREISSALEQLEVDGLPNALGHLDLNPGNVLVSDSRCVFLDWAEAYVGPPCFSLQYLIEHYRRLRRKDLPREIVASYTKQWARFASPREIETSLHLAPLLAAFAYAAPDLVYRSCDGARPESPRFFRALARRMKRESDYLRDRSFSCVP